MSYALVGNACTSILHLSSLNGKCQYESLAPCVDASLVCSRHNIKSCGVICTVVSFAPEKANVEGERIPRAGWRVTPSSLEQCKIDHCGSAKSRIAVSVGDVPYTIALGTHHFNKARNGSSG